MGVQQGDFPARRLCGFNSEQQVNAPFTTPQRQLSDVLTPYAQPSLSVVSFYYVWNNKTRKTFKIEFKIEL